MRVLGQRPEQNHLDLLLAVVQRVSSLKGLVHNADTLWSEDISEENQVSTLNVTGKRTKSIIMALSEIIHYF